MGINNRPGPGESVYRTRAAGEAGGEDDVEGHRFKLSESGESEEDTEGHRFKLSESGESEEDTDDTEGHRVRRL
ncbi:hypothetical protein BH24CHL6_BH24CHL6_07700 [soil metagenome]